MAIIDGGVHVGHSCFKDERGESRVITIAGADTGFSVRKENEIYSDHGIRCASAAVGKVTELKCLKGVSNVPSYTVKGAGSYIGCLISYDVHSVDRREEEHRLDKTLSIVLQQLEERKIHIISISMNAWNKKTAAALLYARDLVFENGLKAVKHGALICNSAGNNGKLGLSTVTGGLAPWVLSVGSIQTHGKPVTRIVLDDEDGTECDPDICAPGDEILCAEGEKGEYGACSGTSIANACVAGMLAYIKAIHQDWTSMRLKSAVMTTASYDHLVFNDPTDALGYGAGIIDVAKAMDPGLVFDVTNVDCDRYMRNIEKNIPRPGMDFNIPSFSIILDKEKRSYTFKRRLTNIMNYSCTFRGYFKPYGIFPSSIKVEPKPDQLEFQPGAQKGFELKVKAKTGGKAIIDKVAFGRLIWEEVGADCSHKVECTVVLLSPDFRKNREVRMNNFEELLESEATMRSRSLKLNYFIYS
ncbi:hypothetical protein CCACVL1_07365 [Corchorus capsularis]|uniref:Peptidase S8/S53 domain-containing protein n=1 Tax=Corchorus capsularis TaxID=210143 RepID=A0A1R3J6F6_COCAP|nr:hypothetical protein CCACVL1_07365 [Corchorus capsularis]